MPRHDPRHEPQSIIYLANSEKIGGGNHVLMDLICGLDPGRFRPVLVAPRPGPLTEWADSAGVPWHALPIDIEHGRLALVRHSLALAILARRNRAAVFHAIAPRCYRAAGVAGAIADVKRICHVQFAAGAGELKWCFRFGIDAVITCYEEQAREVVDALAPRQQPAVVAIPNSVDTLGYTPYGDADTPERWRQGASHVAVIVGHLSEVKGYPTFLQAAAMVSRQLPGCRFLAVGNETSTPGYGATLQEMARELGIADKVDFLGWQTDVAGILRAADVMVLPSLAEGLPLAVLEAMACARPVVATAVNGTPEAVIQGETGLLVAPNAPGELADALLTVLRDPQLAARMGAAGRVRVETHYTLLHFLTRVQGLYDDLLCADGGSLVQSAARAT